MRKAEKRAEKKLVNRMLKKLNKTNKNKKKRKIAKKYMEKYVDHVFSIISYELPPMDVETDEAKEVESVIPEENVASEEATSSYVNQDK